jgi:hypothetical protein
VSSVVKILLILFEVSGPYFFLAFLKASAKEPKGLLP